MNCKKGDVALVVRPGPAYGYIVTCIERYDGPWRSRSFAPGWRVDVRLPSIEAPGELRPFVADIFLRPIRPSDGEDEMLRIAGKPQDVREKVTK